MNGNGKAKNCIVRKGKVKQDKAESCDEPPRYSLAEKSTGRRRQSAELSSKGNASLGGGPQGKSTAPICPAVAGYFDAAYGKEKRRQER